MRMVWCIGLMALLAGCGTAYQSPVVRDGVNDATRVRVVAMNSESTLLANRSKYRPKTLPAIFSTTSGAPGGLRGAGAVPEAPLGPEGRPRALETRLPPDFQNGPYVLGVGDVVLLATPQTASTVEELSGLIAAQNSRQGYTVQDDGAIAIPNVGRVRIAGMTIDEAEAELFQRLVENQIDPTFSLEVTEFKSQRASIGGAVANPTVAPITLTPLFLEQALTAAGGITADDQDFASIRIYRDGTLYQIPLTEFYSRSGIPKIKLKDGDAVFVDTEYNLDRAQAYFQQQIQLAGFRAAQRQAAVQELQTEVSFRRAALDEARGNFLTREQLGAVKRDYVYVTGEVGKQTRFALPFEQQASLADALFEGAGGIPLKTGSVGHIYVLRASRDPREFGAVTAWHLDARNAANFALAAQFEMRPDDVVFVAEQPVTRWNRVITQITPSLITQVVGAATN